MYIHLWVIQMQWILILSAQHNRHVLSCAMCGEHSTTDDVNSMEVDCDSNPRPLHWDY